MSRLSLSLTFMFGIFVPGFTWAGLLNHWTRFSGVLGCVPINSVCLDQCARLGAELPSPLGTPGIVWQEMQE